MRNSRKKKYKVASPIKFFIFVFLTVMISSMAIYTIIGNDPQAATASRAYKQVTVSADDTLWSLADQYGPDNIDNRVIVNEICDTNDISADEMQPGQVIFVPVEM